MKTNTLIIIALIAFLFTSCGSSNKDYVALYRSDMDTQVAWTDNPIPGLIKSPSAKSGIYICRMDSVHPYGPTFNMVVKNITDKKFSHVKISGWMKAESQNAEPNLVLDIHDANNQSIEWLAKKFSGPVLNTKDWEYYEYDVDLTEKNRLNPTNIFRIYVSNGTASAAFCDDLEIAFY
jgi:hypothetical protein